jgi:hypothetical protein
MTRHGREAIILRVIYPAGDLVGCFVIAGACDCLPIHACL